MSDGWQAVSGDGGRAERRAGKKTQGRGGACEAKKAGCQPGWPQKGSDEQMRMDAEERAVASRCVEQRRARSVALGIKGGLAEEGWAGVTEGPVTH